MNQKRNGFSSGKQLFFLFLLFFCLEPVLSASPLSNAAGEFEYPTAGVIFPEQGTIQITTTPNTDLKDLRDGWPFAVCIRGEKNSSATRTAIGIYSNPGKGNGLSALVRGTNRKNCYAVDRDSPVKAGQRVNMALSWGPAGVFFYVDGRPVGSGKFPAEVLAFSPYLKISTLGPFFVSRLAVSSRQLPREELQWDSSRPFTPDADCTLLANDPAKPHYFAAPEFRKRKLVSLLPFDSVSGRIWFEEETPLLRFSAANFTNRDAVLPVTLRLTSEEGKSRSIVRRISIPADTIRAPLVLPLKNPGCGFYQVEAEIGPEKRRFRFTLSILPRIAGSAGALAEYLGTAGTTEPAILGKLGIRWMRSWGRPDFVWYLLEPSSGKFDFRTADALLEETHRNNVRVLAVLGYPPFWAAEPPPSDRKGVRFSDQPGRWKPRSLKEWTRYVRRTAEHFKGRIGHYEIYNECDFKLPGKPATFSGTTEEYFQLLKSASTAIHSADPAARVLVTGFSMVRGAVDSAMPEDLLKRGAADFVDIWNLHSYQVLFNVPEMKRMVHARKPGMPFWQTEHMWHILKDRSRVRYLTAAIAFWFLQEGFEKFFTFGWNEYLSNEHTHSAELPLHVFGVCQQFLRICRSYEGLYSGLPGEEFDVRHVLRRTDGGFLTAIGSSIGNYRIRIANPDVIVYRESGERLSLRDGSLQTGGHLLYLLTKVPLKLESFQLLESSQLLSNRDFEELSGDAMGGVEYCTPAEWIVRTKFDPGAAVTISPGKGNGKYAVSLTTSGKGRVYLFQNLKITNPGTYRISARFQTISGSAKPYIQVYGTETAFRCNFRKNFPPPSMREFQKCSFDVTFQKKPEKPVAIIFGIDKAPGTVLLDDVEMQAVPKQRISGERAVSPPLSGASLSEIWQEGNRMVDLSLLKNAVRKKLVNGIPFVSGQNALVAGGREWGSGRDSVSTEIRRIKAERLFVLACAMYCPRRKGVTVADLILHYEDGKSAVLPLRTGIELGDWYLPAGKQPEAALRFHSPDYKEYGLFLCEWKNPRPDALLNRIELRARDHGTVTAIPAITLERREKKH